MAAPTVVAHEQWLAARRELLAKEKEFTHLRDRLSAERRALPWERVTKQYLFHGPRGAESLGQLFGPRGQLIVYHFMFDPAWEAGCKSCSFWADNFNGIDVHLAQRDTTLIACSRAPFEKIEAYRRRMGWSFKWISSFGSDFNFDFEVSFTPQQVASGALVHNYGTQKALLSERVGISVFCKQGEAIYHSYSCYSRGVDMLNGAYHYLDLTPAGRNEQGHEDNPQFWVKRHDEYAASC